MAKEIPDGKMHFTLNNKEFALDPIETNIELDAIYSRNKENTNYEHLEEFRGWLLAKVQVQLSLGQADWLWDEIRGGYSREKKARWAEFGLLPTTQESTSSA
jgi:hypothetical protein